MKNKIISIIAKLDNGSHSSNQLQGADEALYKLFKNEIAKYQEALQWCGGSDDFQVEGKARKGWEKIVMPLL
jgi:Tfp pilus assembly ATPase PilU